MEWCGSNLIRRHQHRFRPFIFSKNRLSKYFFPILSQNNAQIVNLKNPDLDLIRRIYPECGFYGFIICFWICPKKLKIRFWIRKSGFGFSRKKRTLTSMALRMESVMKSNCWLCRVLTTLTTESALVSWKQVSWTCHVNTERARPIGLPSAGFPGKYSMLPSIRPLVFNIAITFLS